MKDYYTHYIELSLKTCCTLDDLVDKKRLKIHNKAMSQLFALQKEMYAGNDCCSEIILRLLEHEDERVRIGAGAYCILAQIHVEQGKQVLAQIRDSSGSKYMRMVAGQNLDYCVPFATDM